MKVLGIHFQSHDTSVALVENGNILYAASNERFSRRKMDANPPLDALKDCLSYSKTKPQDIDKVVFVGDPFPYSYVGRLKELSWPFIYTKGRYLLWWRKPHLILWELFIATGIPSFLYRELLPRILIRGKLNGFKGKYSYVHHHFAHMYSAYYTSGWKDCLVMCSEGSGFSETMSIYHVRKGEWIKVVENYLPHSAGKFYELVTVMLGFNVLRHPGKITGLAAYGNPNTVYNAVKDLLSVNGLKLKLNYEKYLKWGINYSLTKTLPKELRGNRREDIAAAFQKRLEECIVEIVKKAVEKTGEKKLSFAGGVAANVKLNQRLHEEAGINEIYIHQAMGDDGLALGAALHTAFLNGFQIKQSDNVYFGPDFSEQEIKKSLNKFNLKFSKENNIEIKIAKLLAESKIVARFNGRMEYGPRALGNRSILYKTTDRGVNNWLNKRLKKRSDFMPFAPVTLDSFADKCFKNLKGAEYAARFMTITFDVTSYMKKLSPAVVHVDGTARPQIIRSKDNPSYYKLLEEYYKLTGIPSLINTSFNMHEDPIVCSPDDAIESFLSGSLDYLAIGNYLVSYEQNNKK
ncbi:MAG: carbamoyltransferase C-terminal domain-containing protein [Candidatus Levybacteria bacterium]|nr:carbamoyltransferase C-terminal domain-containing protein [Candidatus Levybacteria bacterium]